MASAASGNATMPRFNFIAHKSIFEKSQIDPFERTGSELALAPRPIVSMAYFRL
jgi:hypothetical protein